MRSASPLRTPSRQRRSEATADRIVAAGLALLKERDFQEVSVALVAERAGVSIGGFYARFQGKDALLHALAAEVVEDCALAVEAALAPARIKRATLAAVIRGYLRVMVGKFREHRGAIVQILRHARAGDRHQLALLQQFNQRVHQRLRDRLAERADRIRHPDPGFAINVGLFVVSAAAREGVLGNALQAYPIAVADARLIEELTRVYLAYLTLPAGAAANR